MILKSAISGDGPPVILLHGLFGAAKNLGVIARALSDGAQVIALDLRNHGDSPHAAGMDYTTMADDVAETAAAMGVAAAAVVGHSMGGKVAMSLALRRAGLVSRLAVLDIAPISYDHDHGDYVRAMQGLKLRPALSRAKADEALAAAIPDPSLRAFLMNNLVLGAKPRWRLGLAEILEAMPALVGWADPPGWRPYEGPALFLRGADSDYVPSAASLDIQIRFPAVREQSIAEAGHWLHAEKPDQVIAALKEFLFDE
jgi:pimeloyl-ACP methyl ester carboxylesterase